VGKPVTKEDIRFTESWREQREGSKISYYLLYTFSWGLAIIFISFFLLMFMGGISIIPIAEDNNKIALIIITGFILGFITTLIVRARNEKRYQKILDRVRKGSV
jgi:quinol-cytochrome oxidoreductase complex cytochrome b subunit